MFKRLRAQWWFILSRFIVLTALAVSLAYNAYLFVLTREYYRQIRELRRDPYGLGLPIMEASDLRPGQERVVFFGDSRIQDWPPPEGFRDFQFVNRGIGGQTSIQVLGRFAPQIAPLRPDIVILQVGINDLTSIAVFPQEKDRILADCLANIEQIVQGATDTGATVILTTIFPVSGPPLERRLFSWSDDVTPSIQLMNDSLRRMTGEQVVILDTYAVLVGDHGLMRPEYAADTLHLNAEGYAALNRELSKVLEKISLEQRWS